MNDGLSQKQPSGPLSGLKVVEFAGLGPAPFCGMLLSDMGAEVIRIDRPGVNNYQPEDVESRGRYSLVIDLKDDNGTELALSIIAKADILIEGYRPGVMEKLGLGPEKALPINPRLVYGRMTGWGQTGPLAQKAGHDLNYLAVSGALHALGAKEKPAVPLNLIADFGGGALYLAMGVLAALHHVQATGEGQVVDCAMVDGVVSMMNMIYGDFAVQQWKDERESNVIDGAAHFYNVYQCRDGKWISVAAIEKPFYQDFIKVLSQEVEVKLEQKFHDQWNKELWPELLLNLQEIFISKDRDQWVSVFEHHDVCVAPVLSLKEARLFRANTQRRVFIEVDGILQAAPSPRFSRTPSSVTFGSVPREGSAMDILNKWNS